VSLALPRKGGEALAKDLYDGMAPLLLAHDIALAGGDTNSWDGPLVIDVTALGEVAPGKEWRRSGARPGDAIVVTGRFGGSILGKHLSPQPRVHEALWLAENADVHAAIDVSDGLSLDLARLAEESKCGAAIDLDAVPIDQPAHDLARQQPQAGTALEHALADGEDFELILAVPPDEAQRLVREQPFETPLSIVGRFVDRHGLWQIDRRGDVQPLAPRGWEHRLEP
jgi:thiamine-monophosphate kinase